MLILVSDNPTPPSSAPWRWGPFLMSPAQHRAQAALLRHVGNEELAKQCEALATLIERRDCSDG
jgi:hypothetical protein